VVYREGLGTILAQCKMTYILGPLTPLPICPISSCRTIYLHIHSFILSPTRRESIICRGWIDESHRQDVVKIFPSGFAPQDGPKGTGCFFGRDCRI